MAKTERRIDRLFQFFGSPIVGVTARLRYASQQAILMFEINMLTLDDATIHSLFGADDAESENDERLKEYFYVNQSYQSLQASVPIRLLVGHKGVGKSALLKRSYIADKECNLNCVWLQPDTLLIGAQAGIQSGDQLIKRITVWKVAILKEILINLASEESVARIPELSSANPKNLLDIISRLLADGRNKSTIGVNIYIDDIDRGWKATPDDIMNISALLNAIRDISGKTPSIRFRLGLRSDVYFLVRTSDESTDKIDGNIIWLRWTNDAILRVLAKRMGIIPLTQVRKKFA